jgi:hypothetical protein
MKCHFGTGSSSMATAVLAAALIAWAPGVVAQQSTPSAPQGSAAAPAPNQSPSQSGTQKTQGQAQKPAAPSAGAPSAPGSEQTQPAAGQKPGQPPTPANAPAATEDDGGTAGPVAVKDAAPPPGSNGTMPGVRPGSIDDVNAVGTRNIGGRGLGNWYSTESEIREGKAYSMEVEKSVRFITDPVVTEYVNRVGQNIVKNSDAKVPFTIKVIDSDEVNAMALPGGFFYVNSGLILAADNEAEMAGVMAHEIAHVAAHHAMREQTRMNYAEIGSIPLIMMTGYSMTGYGIYEATQLAIPMTFLEFSREFEKQADFLGIQYMYRAGYDPQALPEFFEKIENLEKTKPNLIAKAFDTHPQTPDRIQANQEEIARYLPPRQEYVETTSEFQDVKARLARIENKRKLRDGKDNSKPSLRRASNTPSDGNTGSGTADTANGQTTTDDSRPTLHRRDD